MATKRALLHRIREMLLGFLIHKKEGLENLILSRYTEGKRDRLKQRINYLLNLCERIAELSEAKKDCNVKRFFEL